MRKISPNVDLLLNQPTVNTFYLFSIKGAGVDVKYTTYFAPLVIAGLGTFSNEHSIVEFKPPLMERASNREAYKMSFADVSFSLRALAETNLLGARAKFYLGLVNTLPYEVGGAAPGEPLLDLADITLGFDGIIDTKEYTVNPFENVNLFSIECSTPMASLGIERPYMTSKEAVRQLNGSDSAYDQVYEGSAGVTLMWGKK